MSILLFAIGSNDADQNIYCSDEDWSSYPQSPWPPFPDKVGKGRGRLDPIGDECCFDCLQLLESVV